MTLPDSTLQPDDEVLLDELRRAAATIQPDPVFARGLRATLDGAAPRAATEPPAVWRPTPAVAEPRHVSRPTPPRHPRRTGHLATVAAILAIVLVGYAALSLSGRSPSGLRLSFTDQPQASAQGITDGSRSVVGTWGLWATGGVGSASFGAPLESLIQLWTFEADGSLTAFWLGNASKPGNGRWVDNGEGAVTFDVTVAIPSGREETPPADPGGLYPLLYRVSGTFTLSADATTWSDLRMNYTFVGLDENGAAHRTTALNVVADQDGLLSRSPQRITDWIDGVPEMTEAERERWGFADTSASPAAVNPLAASSPVPSSTERPTVTPLPNAAAIELTPTLAPNPSPST